MKLISITVLFIFFFVCSKAQLADELAKKQNDLKNTRILLKKIDKKSEKSIKKLNLINKEIEQSNDLLETISKKNGNLDREISKNEKLINSLTDKNQKIKKEYENLIFFAYKTRNSRDKSTYIFASENFEQGYERFKYLIFLTDYIKETSQKYNKTADSITELNLKLKNQKSEIIKLNNEKEDELNKLAQSKKSQKSELQKLNSKKNNLLAEIEKEEKNAEILRQSIAKQIAEEKEKIEKERKEKEKQNLEQKKKAETKKDSKKLVAKTENKKDIKTENKTESKKIGPNKENKNTDLKNLSDFEKSKGKLKMPLDGTITGKFGNHQHPVLKNVTVKNDGIDITATGDLSVRAVFDGIVIKILTIPGANKAVLLQHGDYFTVYSNLTNVKVSENQKVTKNQILGTVFSEAGNLEKSVMNFQIWKEREKQNPQEWLKK